MSFKNKRGAGISTSQQLSDMPQTLTALKYIRVNSLGTGYELVSVAAPTNVLRGVLDRKSDYGVTGDGSDEISKLENAMNDAVVGSMFVLPAGKKIHISRNWLIKKALTQFYIMGCGATLRAHSSWSTSGKGLIQFEGGTNPDPSVEYADCVISDLALDPNDQNARGISCEGFRAAGQPDPAGPDHIKGSIFNNIKGEGARSVAGYEMMWLKNLENGCIINNPKAEGWKMSNVDHSCIKIQNTDNNGNWQMQAGKLSPASSATAGTLLRLEANPAPINRDRVVFMHFFGRKGSANIVGNWDNWQDGGGRFNNRYHVRFGNSYEDLKIGHKISNGAGSGARGYMCFGNGYENKNDGADFESGHRLLLIEGDSISGRWINNTFMCQGGDANIWNYIECNSSDEIDFYPNSFEMRNAGSATMRIFQGSAFGLDPEKFHLGPSEFGSVGGRTGTFAAGADRFLSPFGDTSIDEVTESDVQMQVPFEDYVIRRVYGKWDINTRANTTAMQFRIGGNSKGSFTIPAGGGAGFGKSVIGGNIDYKNALATDQIIGQNELASWRLGLTGAGNLRLTGYYAVIQKLGVVRRGA